MINENGRGIGCFPAWPNNGVAWLPLTPRFHEEPSLIAGSRQATGQSHKGCADPRAFVALSGRKPPEDGVQSNMFGSLLASTPGIGNNSTT